MHDFIIGFSHLWYVFAITLAICASYIGWKMKGGTLLFRLKKNDDSTTTIFKMIGQFFLIYIGCLVALCVGLGCTVMLVLCAIAALVG